MVLLAIAVMGVAGGYLSVWSAVMFNETTEERVSSLLMGVAIDVIMLVLFTMSGSGGLFTVFLIFKYLFLSAVNFEKTLRQ